MPKQDDELAARVIRLEVKTSSIEDGLHLLHEDLSKVNNKLDKTVSSIDRMAATMEIVLPEFNKSRDELIEVRMGTASRETRVRVIWGIVVSVGLAALAVIGRSLF